MARSAHTRQSCSLLNFRPRKDERLSWPGWLTYSGRFTHISGHPSAAGGAWDRESSPIKDRRSTTVPSSQRAIRKRGKRFDSIFSSLPISNPRTRRSKTNAARSFGAELDFIAFLNAAAILTGRPDDMERAFFSAKSETKSLSVRRHVPFIHLVHNHVQRSSCNVTTLSISYNKPVHIPYTFDVLAHHHHHYRPLLTR